MLSLAIVLRDHKQKSIHGRLIFQRLNSLRCITKADTAAISSMEAAANLSNHRIDEDQAEKNPGDAVQQGRSRAR